MSADEGLAVRAALRAPRTSPLGWSHALPLPALAHLGARDLHVLEHVVAGERGLFGRAELMPVRERRREEPCGDGQERCQATSFRASHPSSMGPLGNPRHRIDV
jgi:hypothetical protein